jgi:radical SAM protein with 4Fe4S-binding SPASM domain
MTMNALAILSMLHEPGDGSATRLFRGQPVLRWTLQRLGRAKRLTSTTILCWDDQFEAAGRVAAEWGVQAANKGIRQPIPRLEAVSAAQRWTDGWRGGLLATCRFDLGFHGPWHWELMQENRADAAVLVEPSAGLVDPQLIDAMVSHAESHASQEICFTPTAPGLGGVLLRSSLLKRLGAAKAFPGRLLHYFESQLGKDPLATDSCVPVPMLAARSADRFTMASSRQVSRLGVAMESLNGQLLGSGAEDLVRRMGASTVADALPREIVLELGTSRATRPIFWAGRSLSIERPDLSPQLAAQLFDELATLDETRLTLAGVGDPMLCPNVFDVIELARRAGVAVHVETDLLTIPADSLARLAESGVDVVSFHLPALTPKTYAAVMGRDGYADVLENVKKLLLARQRRGSSLPIIVPIFTKCHQNFGEMEPWYDQWLKAVESAVIRGPSDCAGQIPDLAMADMSPARRRPCGRISSRVTILSDGRIVSCDEDVTGRQALGRLGESSLAEIWQKRFEALRNDHRKGRWDLHPLCGRCREWHRP